ncbi:acetylxylan esterase [Streptomyces sp. A7024]|uniref:Acetylxylan esterase n=1 Tax=Streptomyces coryli TaxID=1128680 RepID=A0A6G4U720_9ACTN|nr:alpha/beta fold hydrolase [Streptomyces coryli]NGN67792.1 acetylxylan esterase [Streptomyces coryli]
MALFDMPLDQLRAYRPERTEPEDFDAFWKRTLDEAADHDLAAEFRPYDAALSEVEVYDASFAGWGGHRISGWFIVPKGAEGPLPCVMYYIGYHGGRGAPHDHLAWPASGRAVFVVDTRGQGASTGNHMGATADPHGGENPQSPGFMTRGILDPEHYYYRRVFTDAIRGVDAAKTHPAVDPDRVYVCGGSQGGAIATAVAGLRDDVRGAMIDVPFLNHFRRAVEITDNEPYQEIVRFLRTQRGTDEQVFRTLSYFDGTNFAARADCPALYSVALMDQTCPPSTVFASYNHWSHAEKDITVYPWNLHEGGASEQRSVQLRWMRGR